MNASVVVMDTTWPPDNCSVNCSVTSPPRDLTDYVIRRYVFFVLVVFGTVGNVLSVCVLLRPSMRHTSIYFYLLLLAVSDTLVLWSVGLRYWTTSVTGYNVANQTEAGCRTIMFINHVTQHTSSWLVVLMTMDRFVIVWFPLHMATWCSVRRARITGCLTILAAVALDLHAFWTYHLRGMYGCVRNLLRYPFMGDQFEYFNNTTWLFIPFVCVFALNISIIVALRMSANGFNGQSTRRHAGPSTQSNSQLKVVYLLLTVSFTWLALMLPRTLMAASSVLFFGPGRLIVYALMLTNHAINFILYCVTGRKFRRELILFLKGCCCVQRGRKLFKRLGSSQRVTMRTDLAVEHIPMRLNRSLGTENSPKTSTCRHSS